MIPVSDAYKELVKSNIRPTCEPIIKVSGIDNTGKEIELIWNAKNIKDLNYKRSIDPVGRELPYMELTWTEIYTGKLNAESYPEKYNNITKYMQVELSFVQDLGFYNTWKTLFGSGITWKDLFNGSVSWKQLKNQVTKETIAMPKLFLSAKPTISGQTITWSARDLLYFLEDEKVKSFKIGSSSGDYRLLKNVLSYFLIDSRACFLNNRDMFDAISESVSDILNCDDEFRLTNDIIFDGKTKDILKNLVSIENKFLNFKDNKIYFESINNIDSNVIFNSNIMYEKPIIKQGTNISGYSFKSYNIIRDESAIYELSPVVANLKLEDGQTFEYYIFNFKGYGEVVSPEEYRDDSEIIFYIMPKFGKGTPTISVCPINYNAYDNFINNYKVGDIFNENNPLFVYDKDTETAKTRLAFLNNYFNEKSSTIEFTALPNFSLEPSDIVTAETELYDENQQKIFKKVLIVSSEISYNGSFKQKIICHEVEI